MRARRWSARGYCTLSLTTTWRPSRSVNGFRCSSRQQPGGSATRQPRPATLPGRSAESHCSRGGQAPYDVREIVNRIVDGADFLEVQKDFARNLVIGFGRLVGRPVGIVANQPCALAGALDIDASDKGARFIRFCNAFNIPLVTLVDVPGFLPGIEQEHGGIIRHGAKMLFAYSAATVPKLTVVLRKAYGGGYIAMCSKELGADRVGVAIRGNRCDGRRGCRRNCLPLRDRRGMIGRPAAGADRRIPPDVRHPVRGGGRAAGCRHHRARRHTRRAGRGPGLPGDQARGTPS